MRPMSELRQSATETSPAAACLYLGPRGERCAAPAVENGLCARHAYGEELPLWPRLVRQTAALVMLLLFLWIVFADFIAEILRLLP
jgi:hypothetical protein